MKKFLTFAVIIALVWIGGCKKAEKQQGTTASSKGTAKQAGGVRKERRRKKAPEVKPPSGNILEIYNEKVLVTRLSPDITFTTTKIKIDKAEVDAVLLRDLLAQNKVQAKNVILTGPSRSVALTWEQATADGVYVTVNPAKLISVYSASKDFAKLDVPRRVLRITASASPEVTASAKMPRKKPK